MPYMVERIVHCHVVLPVLLVADSAYHNAVGGRCIGGGLLRFTYSQIHSDSAVSCSALRTFVLRNVSFLPQNPHGSPDSGAALSIRVGGVFLSKFEK